jgi:hypothetical protein
MHYLPLHQYYETVVQKFKIVTSFAGDDSIMEILKEKGVNNPDTNSIEQNLKANITTGNYNPADKMSIQLVYLQSLDGDGNEVIPAGTKMLGTIQKNKMPVFDSVVLANEKDDKTKAALAMVKNILSQSSLPSAKMRLGDEYVMKTPLVIPVGPVVMHMTVSTTYKLNKVTDSTAGFDLAMQIDFDMGDDKDLINSNNGKGSGSGVLIYDRIDNFPLKEDINYTLEMTVEKYGVVTKVQLTSTSSHNYKISTL